MKIEQELNLLQIHLSMLKEVHQLQPDAICFDATESEFSYSQQSQLIPFDEAIELLNYYTFVNSKSVHALPFCLAIIEILLYKTNLHCKIFSDK